MKRHGRSGSPYRDKRMNPREMGESLSDLKNKKRRIFPFQMAGASTVSITIDGAAVLDADTPTGGEDQGCEKAVTMFMMFVFLCTQLARIPPTRPVPLTSHTLSLPSPASASTAFAALKSSIGACLTAKMKERAIEEGEAVDVLEEVISDDDLEAETAALAGGALPKARSKPRPPGKGRNQQQRGVKRSAPTT